MRFMWWMVPVALWGCGASDGPPRTSDSPPTTQRYSEVRTLSTGKSIKMIGIHRDEAANSIDLEYLTDLRLDQRSSLETEVEQVWRDLLKVEAEKAGALRAYVLPQERDEVRPDAPTTQRAVGFVYARGSDGRWSKASGFSAAPSTRPSSAP